MPGDGNESLGAGTNTGLYSLKWNSFQTHLSKGLKSLIEDDEFTDITLAAEGGFLKAHKFHLSMCSPFFKRLLRANTRDNSNTIVILNNVPFRDLENIIRFIYYGEVNINQADLRSFLNTGELLQIEGLSNFSNSENSESQQENSIQTHQIINTSGSVSASAGSINNYGIDSSNKVVSSAGRRFSRSGSVNSGNRGRPIGKVQSKRTRATPTIEPSKLSSLNSGPPLLLTPNSVSHPPESLIYSEPPIKSRKSTLRQGASSAPLDPLNTDSYEIERRNEESQQRILPQSSIKIEMTDPFNSDSAYQDESHESYKVEIPGTSSAPNVTQTKQAAAQDFAIKLRNIRSLLTPDDPVEKSNDGRNQNEDQSFSNQTEHNEENEMMEDANNKEFNYGYQFTPAAHILPNTPVLFANTELPVVCPYCGKVYKNKNSLKVHRSMVHRGITQNEKKNF